MVVQPYLYFEGRCDEAIEFYTQRVGAKLGTRMTYGQMPGRATSPMPPTDKVMHASLTIGETELFVSDGHCRQFANFDGFGLSLRAADPTEVEKLFTALSDGGIVTMPLSKTFFASAFGMVTDRFGVDWLVMSA